MRDWIDALLVAVAGVVLVTLAVVVVLGLSRVLA